MAQRKLTPMEFRRKYCKHEPRFEDQPEPESQLQPQTVAMPSQHSPVKAKVA